MAIKRWDPFSGVDAFRDELSKLVDEVLRVSWGAKGSTEPWPPGADIFEIEGVFYIEMDLPGVDPKDVEVAVDGSTVTVRGHRSCERRSGAGSLYRVERYAGAFTRRFELPKPLDPRSLETTFEGGVLRVAIRPLPGGERTER